MKKKAVLLISLFTAGTSFAVSASERLQSARQKFNATFGGAAQKVRNYVNNYGGCYFSGTCSPEVSAMLKSLAVKVGLSVAALLATAAVTGGAAYYLSADGTPTLEDAPPTFGVSGVSIEAIAANYGEKIPIDNSPIALVVRGAYGGAVDSVEGMKELVDKKILQIAYDAADAAQKSITDVRKHPVYEQIKTTLENEINRFSPAKLKRNKTFIWSAITGLVDEVKSVVCSVASISQNVINEAITRLKRMERPAFSGQEAVLNFLENPVCGSQ